MKRTATALIPVVAAALTANAFAAGEQCAEPPERKTSARAASARPSGLVPLIRFPSLRGGSVLADRSHRIEVHYGDGIDPDSFRAVLNGHDVTEAFDLLAGKERVELPLEEGSNTLKIRVARMEPPTDGAPLDSLPQIYRMAVITHHPEPRPPVDDPPIPQLDYLDPPSGGGTTAPDEGVRGY